MLRRLSIQYSKGSYIFLSIVILGFLITINPQLNAQYIDPVSLQNLKINFEYAYGLDQDLINGFRYRDRYPDADGHPFFGINQFSEGKVIINGKEYRNLLLKYDIVEQDIILQYKNSVNGIEQIQLNTEKIPAFELNGKLFRQYEFPVTGRNYFQQITNGKIQCLYLWEKELNISGSANRGYYNYSKQRKRSFLIIEDVLYEYNGLRSFVNLFPSNHQEIRRAVKGLNIKIKKASDNNMVTLIARCTEILYPSKDIDAE
ncbi:MAG: hypothetical protein JXJ22_10295 [Bacteroidales bacterium]|nr:hypothetical protein [Bacteroidales bacterium]